MAALSTSGVLNGQTIQASHVTQLIDAFTGVSYDLTISGTFNATGSTITGSISNATSASKANTLLVSALGGNTEYFVPYLQTTSSYVSARFDASTFTYNPATSTLTVTASRAVSSSFALTTPPPIQVAGTIYPSGSVSVPNSNLKMIAGASKTGAGPTTVSVNITELNAKTLGQNCFITATASGSAGANNSIVINSLGAGTIIFESLAPSTDFYYNVIYI
jgi:hypothetical protein